MEQALVIATIVVPLYTAILHGGVYARRRHDRAHLWLAVSALAISAMAVAITLRGQAADATTAIRCQKLTMLGGTALAVSFPKWCHAFLGIRRPRVEKAALAFAALVLAANACDRIFSDELALLPFLAHKELAPAARLSSLGIAIVLGFGVISLYLGWELGRAARSRPETRAAFAGYCVFGLTLAHDIGVGAELRVAPMLLPIGYLVMIAGLSNGLVGEFVRSLQQAEQRATDLSASLAERSAELRHKEQLLFDGERLAALGTLAAGVAHEINDPLAFVSSNLNRAEEIWDDPVERHDVPEILDECREGLARLRGTVSELLRLARRRESEPVSVDLSALVASVLPLVRAEGRFRARWTELLTHVPAVRGDPGLLAQVALQLLLNALRSVPEGAPGEHRIHVSTASEGGRVFLRVRDSGPPIPADELRHLFDPFAPLPGHGNAPRLGLAVTHQIVTSHGGDIEVESDARGTEVSVWLPVDRGDTRPPA